MEFEDWLTTSKVKELECPACGHFSLARIQEVWDARELEIHKLKQLIEFLHDRINLLQGRPLVGLHHKLKERK